jgi:O-antigen/teichoic acid export membrane protein
MRFAILLNPVNEREGSNMPETQMTQVVAIIGLLIALSVATERLVEIFKIFPFLNEKITENNTHERLRRVCLHVLAILAGILTVYLAEPIIPKEIIMVEEFGIWQIIALGLLASGGSGFWNSMLMYVLNVKDIKKYEAEKLEKKSS